MTGFEIKKKYIYTRPGGRGVIFTGKLLGKIFINGNIKYCTGRLQLQ